MGKIIPYKPHPWKKGQVPKSAFKKGHITWNTGKKTGLIPKSAFKKGTVPWNKDIKGIHLHPETEFKEGLIPWNKGKHGVQKNLNTEGLKKGRTMFKDKPRFNMRGKNHPNWKGGITKLNMAIRQSIEYKVWRRKVFERDDYICQLCGKRGNGELNADHIKPFAYFVDLRFELSNGRTLCKECHRNTDTYGEKVKSQL